MILLPASPLPNSATPRPLDFGGWQEPIAGGVESRLDRPGNRFALDLTTPNLRPEPDGRIWASRLVLGLGLIVRTAFLQPGFDIGAPGTPVVNGAGQAGTTINLRGFAAGYTVREGQFFHLVDPAGRRYLHAAAADVTANGSGVAAVPISMPLRAQFADGAVAGFAAPTIEGKLSGNDKGWTQIVAKTRGLSFTISEVR